VAEPICADSYSTPSGRQVLKWEIKKHPCIETEKVWHVIKYIKFCVARKKFQSYLYGNQQITISKSFQSFQDCILDRLTRLQHSQSHILYMSLPSALSHCWLGIRKSIQPVKNEWWGAAIVIYLEWDTKNLHMVQMMPLPPHHLSHLFLH